MKPSHSVRKTYFSHNQAQGGNAKAWVTHTCILCNFVTWSKKLFEHHDLTEHGDRKCTTCSLEFPTRFALVEHQDTQHSTNLRTYESTYYMNQPGSNDTNDILDTESLQCSYCDYKTIYKKNLTEHEREVHLIKRKTHGVDAKLFKCSMCEYQSNSQSNITSHEKYIHRNVNRVKCNLCSAEFKSESTVKLHKRDVHGLEIEYSQCSQCSYKSLQKSNVTSHIKIVHEGLHLYKCNECTLKFKSRQGLKSHRKNEHGAEVKHFQCSKCPYKTIRKSCITKHENAVHERKSVHKCSICSEKFISPYKLNLHKRNEHGIEVGTFQCSKCAYTALKKGHLERHEKSVHEGVCLYKCSMCPDSFKSIWKLNRHRDNEHSSESMHFYKCKMCSASFKSTYTLNLHKKSEHGMEVKIFQCSKCDYKSIKRDHLIRHEKSVHEGMSLVKCSICSETFKSSTTLSLHRESKHGVEIEYYKCSKCEYRTLRKGRLKQHEAKVHKPEIKQENDTP